MPVLVARKRSEGIEKGILEYGIDVAILDDGFQVRNVGKDIELLVVNGLEPETAMHLFPLGIYREPFDRARRADAILINGGEIPGRLKDKAGTTPAFRVRYQPLYLVGIKDRQVIDYHAVEGKKVLAFSALGNNSSFHALLKDLGADVVRTMEFPDHHRYEARDIQRIASLNDVDMRITTEKDAVKIERFEGTDDLFYLAIEARIEEEDALIDLVINNVRG